MTSSNPAFSRGMFAGYEQVYGAPRSISTTTTVQGTVGKTALLLAILSATALWAWNASAAGRISQGLLAVSAIGGFVVAMITTFKPTAAPVTAPLYAALEGVFLGALSQFVEAALQARAAAAAVANPLAAQQYGGIAFQAVVLTVGVLAVMLVAYQTRLIRVTDKLRSGILIATGALLLFYLVTMVLGLFGVPVPLRFSTGPLGIAFSLLVVGLAAFNLLLDFDFIEQAADSGAPKYMEWYGAFGLMVTLVWLYIEILRLLMILANQRDND